MRDTSVSGRQRKYWWQGRWRFLTIGVLLLCMPLLGIMPTAAAPPDNGPHADAGLLHQAAGNPNQIFRVIIQGKGNHGRAAAEHAAAAAGGAKLNDVADMGVVMQLPGKALAALAKHKDIKYISLDSPVQPTACSSSGPVNSCSLTTLYPQASNATGLWPSGLTGKGIGVAVVDTGVSAKPDFDNRLVASQKFSSTTTNQNDGYGHGTHVAGIIAGNSWSSSNSSVRGLYIGVAPQANIVNVKVADDTGMAYTSDIVNGIDWVIANRDRYNIRVLNLSMEQSTPESYHTSILDAEVEKAWFNGIMVVVAAGNNGPLTAFYPPMNDPFVITVGAADVNNTADQHDDFLAPWSSYGVTQDGIVKPDLVAPGRVMYSVLASKSVVLAQEFPSRITPDGNYIWLSGTSMAAPVVSGVAALIFQAHPEYTNDQVKWLMMQTATPPPLLALGMGAGEVNATAAAGYSGTPGYANQGLLISLQLLGPNGATSYDLNTSSSSWSSSSWSSSSWSSSSWSSSSWSSSSWSSSSWSSSTAQ
ncbi:MAG TPA: S8 family peptidase [Thermomicrobiaceae bacterium]|nr:S8 family peptidase [Thermomicrobiaceae bacterium]